MPGGKDIQMFMDSGADASIISKDILPSSYTSCQPVYVSGVNSQDKPKLCNTVIFPATIGGLETQLFAAVADPQDLPHPCIIGRSLPGSFPSTRPLLRRTAARHKALAEDVEAKAKADAKKYYDRKNKTKDSQLQGCQSSALSQGNNKA